MPDTSLANEIAEAEARVNELKQKDDAVASKLGKSIEEHSNPNLTQAQVTIFGTSTLAFGLIVIAIMAWLIFKKASATMVLRSFGIVLIIVCSIFLMVVGWSESQIAPVVGLFGTIAGYLLGKGDRQEPQPDPAGPPAPNKKASPHDED